MSVPPVYATGPESFYFYVVARVGPVGRHLPLAVASCAEGYGRGRARCPLAEVCLQITEAFSAPENRAAIEAERSLADAFYRDDGRALERVYPSEDQPIRELGLLESLWPEDASDSYHDGEGHMHEFPFTATVLLQGLGQDDTWGAGTILQFEPLGMAFNDEDWRHGMVVIDVSDLEKVRYGIVAFMKNHWLLAGGGVVTRFEGWDFVEYDMPDREPTVILEEPRPRIPRSAIEYVEHFGCYIGSYGEEADAWRTVWKGIEVIEPSATALYAAHIRITRDRIRDADKSLVVWPKLEDEIPGVAEIRAPLPRTLEHQAIRSLIGSTRLTEQYDMSIFAGPLMLREFRNALRLYVDKSPDRLGPTVAAGQLLGLAYGNEIDLNWLHFRNLSYEGVASALDSPEIHKAGSLFLCIDNFQGDPGIFLDALGRHKTLRKVCLLQDPGRVDEGPSKHIIDMVKKNLEFTQLLESKSLLLTCLHNPPLRKTLWSRTEKTNLLSQGNQV